MLAAGTILALAASAAAVPARNGAAGVTLSSAVVTAPWKEGWLRPGAAVHLTGRVGAPSHVKVALRPVARPGVVTARADLDVARAGPFTAKLALPPRPLPGSYRLEVTALHGKKLVGNVARIVAIASPVEGVVGPALVGTTRDGPWLRYDAKPPVVDGAHNELWMRFVFLSPPREHRVQVVWKRHWRVVVGRVNRPYQNTIETYARAGGPLPSGVWNVVLRVDGRVAKRMAVRLRSAPSASPSPPKITVG